MITHFHLPFDEAAVRRLCGPATFASADALQRSGHVLGPTISGQTLTSRVRGTWNRVNTVSLRIVSDRVTPTCDRDGAVFCRHAGALMLDVLRKAEAIVLPSSGAAHDALEVEGQADTTNEPLDRVQIYQNEMLRLLERSSVPQMRDLARRRGAKLSGSKRDAILEQLAMALVEPGNIDAALATLPAASRVALDALYMANLSGPATGPTITLAFHALGGRGQPPLKELEEIGLAYSVVHRDQYGWNAAGHYILPRAVVSRLAPLESFARVVSSPLKRPAKRADNANAELGVEALLLMLASEARAGRLERHAASRSIDDITTEAVRAIGTGARAAPAVSVTPPPLVADAARARLDVAPEVIEFGVQLLLTLGVVLPHTPFTIRDDLFEKFLAMPEVERRLTLIYAWLTAGSPQLFTVLFGAGGSHRLVLPSHNWLRPFQEAMSDIARLVTRSLGRMAPDIDYDTASFVDHIDAFGKIVTPGLSSLRHWSGDAQAYTIFRRRPDGTEEPLVIRAAEGWLMLLSAIIEAMLAGPLRWLGLVDAVRTDDGVTTFRVQPAAGALTQREMPDGPDSTTIRPTISDDLSLFIPPGGAARIDPILLSFLGSVAELVDVSAAGLRYQITARGAHYAFNEGMFAPEMVEFLEGHSGKPLPKAAAARIDDWWQRYGTVRLYDELAVIELADDLLLPELLAATGLRDAILHTFSPRLIAIDASNVAATVADLTARGYAPRVIEEA